MGKQDNYWLTYGNVDSSEVTLLAHSSLSYNCHSYAWHVSEDGNAVWVNDLDGNHNDIDNVNKYWDDFSYVETSQANHQKVFYHPETQFDHSAITTSQTDWFISKWTNGPLVRHKYDNCPYWNSSVDLTYYKLGNPIISGSTDPLCDDVQRTFTESAFTNIDLDYDWNFTSPVAEVSDDDESTYTVKGTSQKGQGTVSLTVTTLSGANATSTRYFWVDAPDISNLTIDADGLSAEGYSYADIDGANCRSALEYEWDLPNTNDRHTCIDLEYVEIEYYEDPPASSEVIRVRGMNTCGVSDWLSTTVDDCGGYYMMFSPNPTTSETTLSIESTSAEEPFDDNVEWGIEVYDQLTLKEKKTKLKGKSTQIKTHGWKDGVYVVRVKYKDEILTGKLVVKQ